MSRKRKILFLCTGNACRSQMAEALLRHLGDDGFEVASAGSHPAGFIHPLATECMKRMEIPMDEQYSKSWHVFTRDLVAQEPIAQEPSTHEPYTKEPFDIVITLCDDAAGLSCPDWPGKPLRIHWSLPDPAAHLGSGEDQMIMALRLAERLRTKIEGLIALDWSMSASQLKERLGFLGEI